MPRPISRLQAFFLHTWYAKTWWYYLLLPLSGLFYLLALFYAYWQKQRAYKLPIPVVVIGNISVGGTGKTPVIIALTRALQQRGLAVGVISRGYGSDAPSYPYQVNLDDCASVAGDEPLLIAQRTQAPVVIGSDRVAAAQYLLTRCQPIDIILSDDGLQHYRLARSLEVAVIDGQRAFGNGYCLPAGPLREPISRLTSVDWVIRNDTQGQKKSLAINTRQPIVSVSSLPQQWQNVANQTYHPLSPLPWQSSTKPQIAIAGIGHPQRFFNTLKHLKLDCSQQAFSDHHHFSKEDFSPWQDHRVLMTEKDAIKCREFAQSDWWALGVEITLPDHFVDAVASSVNTSREKREASTT